jgi:CRP/FNR family transcriptional regulator, dissimilatory nitrate respiration regulator
MSRCDGACANLTLYERSNIVRSYCVNRENAIYYQDDEQDGVYYVSSGLIALEFTDYAGNRICDRLIHGGGSFGYASFLMQAKHSVSAIALVTSRVLHLSSKFISSLSRETCLLRRGLEDDLARAVIARRTDLMAGERRNLRSRILWLVLQFAEQQQQQYPLRISIPINYSTMARVVNATPESFSRAIRRLEEDGICRFEKNWVEIHLDIRDVDNEVAPPRAYSKPRGVPASTQQRPCLDAVPPPALRAKCRILAANGPPQGFGPHA